MNPRSFFVIRYNLGDRAETKTLTTPGRAFLRGSCHLTGRRAISKRIVQFCCTFMRKLYANGNDDDIVHFHYPFASWDNSDISVLRSASLTPRHSEECRASTKFPISQGKSLKLKTISLKTGCFSHTSRGAGSDITLLICPDVRNICARQLNAPWRVSILCTFPWSTSQLLCANIRVSYVLLERNKRRKLLSKKKIF